MEVEQRVGDQSGGVNISGGQVDVGGDIVGRDKVTMVSQSQLDDIFRPVSDAVRNAPLDKQAEAAKNIEALKAEVAKGKDANDSTMAKLVDGLIGLVPAAVSAVVSAFATPILGGIAGPVTKFVLDKIQAK